MKKCFLAASILTIFLLLASCSGLTPATPAPLPQPTATSFPTPTEIPLPTAEIQTPVPIPPTPEATSTSRPVSMIKAEIAFDNYSLRVGPGRLFERIDLYETGAFVVILGGEQSNNWVMVQTEDNRVGWMNIVGLIYSGSLLSLPIFVVDNAQILRGHVFNIDKSPASGVVVSIAPVGNNDPNKQDKSVTNAEGVWSVYLPFQETGLWFVGANSYDCGGTAVTNKTDCSLRGNLPQGQTVSLPLSQDVAIEFALER
ncbi:MAG: hypothetical protein NTZ74_16315 [Chloroflexi bacterium]|nr:hypothetical protein [Chloroflexota bacterium]